MDQIINRIKKIFSTVTLKFQKTQQVTNSQQSIADNQSFIDMVVNYHKLLNRYKGLINECSPKSIKRIESAFKNSKNKLEKILEHENMKIVNLEGHEYTPNLGVEVVNIEDFADNSELVISKMLEPRIVSNDGKILNFGKSIIERKEI